MKLLFQLRRIRYGFITFEFPEFKSFDVIKVPILTEKLKSCGRFKHLSKQMKVILVKTSIAYILEIHTLSAQKTG